MTININELRQALGAIRPEEVAELLDRLEATEKERDDVAQQLVQSEIGKRKISEAHDALRVEVGKLSDLGNSLKGDEIRRLAREYAEQRRLKGKEPLECVVVEKDWPEYEPTWKAIEARVTGAKLVQGVPDGWLHAIDEALVAAHLSVANPNDTYERAKAKLNNLIGFHVDVATDPAVNGGWKLVPMEINPDMTLTFLVATSNPDRTVQEVWSAVLAVVQRTRP